MLQELQNSILDLNRQLEAAKARENTMLAVDRQHKADIVSMTAQMNSAEQQAADCEHKLAAMSTDCKVIAFSDINICKQRQDDCSHACCEVSTFQHLFES